MLAVSAVLPDAPTPRPPLLLVHGAANSALVWCYWQRELAARGWASYALDLRGHGKSGPLDLSHTTMEDYASDVITLAGQLQQKPVVMGWSMGGLAAMMAAAGGHASACVALAPSAPALEPDATVTLRAGEFGPEEYGMTGSDPDAAAGVMPDLDAEERAVAMASLGRESRRARDERTRGIVIPSLPCPLLLVTGTDDLQWPASRYDGLWLPRERLTVEGASHWGLVLNRRAIARTAPAVTAWLQANARQG